MIRPEAMTWIARWREVGIGLAILGLGIYWAFTAFGILLYIAFGLIFIGVLLIWEGTRRARFPARGGGPGVVEVDERQITYFSPQGGGAVSVDALTRIEIHTTALGPMFTDLYWIFKTDDGPGLLIPGDAENAGALFDALAALNGVDYEAATRAAGTTERAEFVIWQRPVRQLH